MGKDYEPKALVKELMKDLMFYEESGGGVTLSGGEVMMMDIDYLLAIAKELKRNGISLFIDTCGYVPYERLSKSFHTQIRSYTISSAWMMISIRRHWS